MILMMARTTIKETNIHDMNGNIGSKQGAAYDPNDIARTTIKETNIHDNRYMESNQEVWLMILTIGSYYYQRN